MVLLTESIVFALGTVRYFGRMIFPIWDTASVIEVEPGKWDILEHGWDPYVFVGDTVNPVHEQKYPLDLSKGWYSPYFSSIPTGFVKRETLASGVWGQVLRFVRRKSTHYEKK